MNDDDVDVTLKMSVVEAESILLACLGCGVNELIPQFIDVLQRAVDFAKAHVCEH